MSFVLKILAVSNGEGQFLEMTEPVYLKSYDVEAHNGRGDASLTDKRKDAMQFVSLNHAASAWNTQSKIRPLRDDGKPNKPLTAFTIEVEELK